MSKCKSSWCLNWIARSFLERFAIDKNNTWFTISNQILHCHISHILNIADLGRIITIVKAPIPIFLNNSCFVCNFTLIHNIFWTLNLRHTTRAQFRFGVVLDFVNTLPPFIYLYNDQCYHCNITETFPRSNFYWRVLEDQCHCLKHVVAALIELLLLFCSSR